jgi:hypothetical protein
MFAATTPGDDAPTTRKARRGGAIIHLDQKRLASGSWQEDHENAYVCRLPSCSLGVLAQIVAGVQGGDQELVRGTTTRCRRKGGLGTSEGHAIKYADHSSQ